MRPLAPKFEKVWYLITATGIVSSLPLEWWFPGWANAAMWAVIIGNIVFLAVEYVAGDTHLEGYYTGFFWFKISSDKFRWLCGLWLALLDLWRLPHPINWVVGLFLFAWLPMHYAVKRFEKRFEIQIRQSTIQKVFIVLWVLAVIGGIIWERS